MSKDFIVLNLLNNKIKEAEKYIIDEINSNSELENYKLTLIDNIKKKCKKKCKKMNLKYIHIQYHS